MCKFVHSTTMWKIKALPRGQLHCNSSKAGAALELLPAYSNTFNMLLGFEM